MLNGKFPTDVTSFSVILGDHIKNEIYRTNLRIVHYCQKTNILRFCVKLSKNCREMPDLLSVGMGVKYLGKNYRLC